MISEINIIRLLLYNKKFFEKVYSELERTLFDNNHAKEIFDIATRYYLKHSKMPEDNIKLLIYNNDLDQDKQTIEEKISIVNIDIDHYKNMDIDNLLIEVEEWIKKQRFSNFITDGVINYEDSVSNKQDINYCNFLDEIKKISEFTFDNSLGLDISNSQKMFEEHLRKDVRVKFNNSELNRITKGGVKLGSLNVVVGPPHAGKSRFLSTMAIDYAKADKHNRILYITLEMGEGDIATKIDAAMINKTKEEISHMKFEEYNKCKQRVDSICGKIKIKEYPTASITTTHIRSLFNECIQKGFTPNVVIVDYIGIMNAQRKTADGKLYDKGKAISEELRGFAAEHKIVVWTAVQMNRSGASKRDGKIQMEDIAESYAINATGDFMLFIIKNEELFKQKKQLFKITKNRPGDGYCLDMFLFADIYDDKYVIDFVSIQDQINMNEESNDNEYDGKFKNYDNSNSINKSMLVTQPRR